jgi:hypothetical protein
MAKDPMTKAMTPTADESELVYKPKYYLLFMSEAGMWALV